MNASFRAVVVLIVFSLIHQLSFSQGKVNMCVEKLNTVHKQGRLMFIGATPEIFLNIEEKILDMGNYSLSLENVQVSYVYEARQLPNKKYHGVKFSCFQGNCIKFVDTENGSSVTSFFKSKKDCYDFINVLNELKKALVRNIGE